MYIIVSIRCIDLQTYCREALSWENWWLSRGKFLTLQLNPAMRGVSEEATGYWVVRLHTERRLLTLYFLAIRNLRNFEFATKNEAIVDAPWVSLCASYYGIVAVFRKIWHIHTTRGLPLLVLLQWQSQGLE